MPREIAKDFRHPNNGRVILVQDRHDTADGSLGKDRWFVEMQIRFDDEASARAFFEDLIRSKQLFQQE